MLLDLDLKDNIPVALKISTLKTTGVKVVLMSTYSEPNVVREALAAGALGYLVKSEDAEHDRRGDPRRRPGRELRLGRARPGAQRRPTSAAPPS